MVLKHDHYDGITVDLLIAQRLHLFNLFFFIATLTAWVCQRWLCSWWLPLELWITSCPPSATTMHARGRRSAQLERHTVLKMYTCRIFGVVATERRKKLNTCYIYASLGGVLMTRTLPTRMQNAYSA